MRDYRVSTNRTTFTVQAATLMLATAEAVRRLVGTRDEPVAVVQIG